MAKIAILGAGIMATALTYPLTDNGHTVNLVGTHLDEDIITSIQNTGVHTNLDLKVNEGVTAYQLADAAEAFEGADLIMSGVNSFGVEWVAEQFKGLLKPGDKVLSITKGLHAEEDGTLTILPEVIKQRLGSELADQIKWGAITGPSIAGELAVGHDTAVVFTSVDQDYISWVADLFRTDYYHVWTSTDWIGCEVAAAAKNIYAFGAGFAKGILASQGKENDRYVMFNYGAGLFAQGSVELRQFIELLGGNGDTATGLCGVGDMFVTSMGGRNVKAGTFVGQGVKFSEVRDVHMKGVTLEGVAAIGVVGAALKKLTERGVIKPEDFPFCRYLYSVVAEDAPLDLPWATFFGGEK
ncbi:NAD(P)H-dependent glycerol-3-phosphate dehydrogenase [Propionibacteriaceae bacterium Y1923]|uniref:NAD(P)H-dependent glycerol-3-phosphate dehydrogenase n=1 Tax=Aestuariimicrobium sp. Y1814 TaxID=3418742 RepID=UPI003C14B850